MTDKQIIIDGVDVSVCEFLTKTGHCKAQMSIMGIDTNKCKCFPNCYYKQLKRKEQECEGLKKECETWKNQVLILDGEDITVQITQQQFEDYNQLKKENDTLRQFLSKEPLALQALQSGYASYKKSSDVFYEMVKQYKQTIAEIKEIVGIGLVDGLQSEEYSGFLKILQAQVLQKISECEVNDD